jgi:hypothetical protein
LLWPRNNLQQPLLPLPNRLQHSPLPKLRTLRKVLRLLPLLKLLSLPKRLYRLPRLNLPRLRSLQNSPRQQNLLPRLLRQRLKLLLSLLLLPLPQRWL